MKYIKLLQEYSWWGNSAYDYALALGIIIGTLLLLKIFQIVILTRIKKWASQTHSQYDDTIITAFSNISAHFYVVVSIYIGLRYLTLPEVFDKVITFVFFIVVVHESIKWIEHVGLHIIKHQLKKRAQDDADESQFQSVIQLSRLSMRIGLWVLGIVLVLSNVGVNVTSLVASLGIGGIAIALALQNILTDLFSSYSIYVDKPFEVGDFIIVGEDMGVVKKVGLKTTRIQTLLGEELVISNNDLTSARVRNFKRMEKRRVIFSFGVLYETPKEKLEKIPMILKDIVEGIDNTEFERSHFAEYGDFSLNFETVYYIQSSDYTIFMDIKQQVLLAVFDRFKQEDIEFAYPTQQVYTKST